VIRRIGHVALDGGMAWGGRSFTVAVSFLVLISMFLLGFETLAMSAVAPVHQPATPV
jgi:hypothetical protein